MKTKEELDALKEEVEALNKKLAELTEEELKQIAVGRTRKSVYCKECGYDFGPSIHSSIGAQKEYCPVCKKMVYVR